MKKLIITLLIFASTMTQAQDQKNAIPQVTVTGEGKLKVTPDQAIVTIGVENTGKDAQTVKKANDEIIDKVLKFIKSKAVPQSDFQTTNVSLYKNYDYEKKKYNYVANQTICITLKDLKKYDDIMNGLTEVGITNINGVEFKSSKLETYEAEARKKAILAAKQKASDYVIPLGQKLGKILLITDTAQTYYPQPMYKGTMAMSADAGGAKETLAVGEIEILATVQATFAIE